MGIPCSARDKEGILNGADIYLARMVGVSCGQNGQDGCLEVGVLHQARQRFYWELYFTNQTDRQRVAGFAILIPATEVRSFR
jgi:hypothetical protein